MNIKSWQVSGARWSSHTAVCGMQISRSHFMLHALVLRAYQVFSTYHDSALLISSADIGDIQQMHTRQWRNQKSSSGGGGSPVFSVTFLPCIFPSLPSLSLSLSTSRCPSSPIKRFRETLLASPNGGERHLQSPDTFPGF